MAGGVAAAGAAAFWHYSGQYGMSVLYIALYAFLFFENRSLRKQLNELKNSHSSNNPPSKVP